VLGLFQVHEPTRIRPYLFQESQNLGDYIKKFRKEKGLLLREFAQQLGFAEFTLMKWENGRGCPIQNIWRD